MKRIASLAAAVAAAVSVRAASYTNRVMYSYTSPRAAANWNDSSLWFTAGGAHGVPNGSADTAIFLSSSYASSPLFITNGVALSLQKASASSNEPKLAYVSEQTVTSFDHTKSFMFPWLYAPITVAAGCNTYWSNTRFCGDLSIPSGRTCLFHGTYACHFHYDRYATAAGAVREIPAWQGTAQSYNMTMNFYAPESSTAAVANKFNQVAGSPFLERSGSATKLPVGTLVTGAGIPTGTYLKRVFPTRSWIELSQPVTTTADANSLTFAAFTPKVHHRIAVFAPNNSVCQTRLNTAKYGAADEFVIDIGFLTLYPLGTYTSPDTGKVTISDRAVIFGLSPYDEGLTPTYPGRFVIHQVSDTRDTNVQLETCDILLSNTTNPNMLPGLPYTTVRVPTATAEAQLAVTGAMTAVVGEIQNLKGSLAKTGSGTLRVGFTTNQVANTGSLAVEEGVFAIADPGDAVCKSADEIPTVGDLTIGSSGTLRLPARGLRVTGALSASSGAVIEGACAVYCAKPPYLKGATVSPDVTFVIGETGLRISDIPAPATEATLPGDPAFWVDCSQTNTMTLVALDYTQERSTTGVYRINDVRKKSDGDKYLFSTNCCGNSPSAHMPVLQYDRSKDLHHVFFKGFWLSDNERNDTKSVTNTDTHAWSRPVVRIRTLFEVYGGDGSDADGGTQGSAPILGSTSYARLKNASPAGISPASADSWGRYSSGKHCFLSWATKAMLAGEFHVNGRLTVPGSNDNPLKEYPPYGSPLTYTDDSRHEKQHYRCYPMVVDMTIPATLNGSAVNHAADAYTFTPGYCNQLTPAKERKRLFELIVYTNELTAAEVVSVRRYLMRKWLGQDAAVTVSDMNPQRMGDLDCTVDVTGADDVILAERVASDASFTKRGAGTVSVEDAGAPEADVTVSAGTLKLRSLDLTRPPTNADDRVRLLLDASQVDDAHFTLGTDAARGVRTVLNWKDQKPADQIDFTPLASASTNLPFIVENALNGLSVVDFGPFFDLDESAAYSDKCPALVAPSRQYGSHAVIAVWGSARGGGSLLGQEIDHWNMLGLCREAPTYGGSKDDPLIHQISCNPLNNASSYLCRRNGTSVDPTKTGLSGTFDLVSHVMWTPIDFDALQLADNDSRRWMGGGQFGEMLILDIGPAAPHLDELEAYFLKKWFGTDTVGHRVASLKSLAVASGATVEVTGGGLLHVRSLAAAGGTVKGGVVLDAGAELTVPVSADGTVTPVAIDGSLDLSQGGTVKFTGAPEKLRKGTYTLVTGVGDTAAANWTVDTSNLRKKYRRNAVVEVKDGDLRLTLTFAGVVLTIR